MEENNIISDEEEIANIMNNYFINVTKTLNLKKQLGVGCSGKNEFENHISIKMIHEKYPEILPESFKFQLVSNNEVKKEIENLDAKKSSTYGSIPATILKQCVNAYLLMLFTCRSSHQSSDVFCLLEIRGNFFFCIFSGNYLKSSRNFISTGSSTIEDHSNIAYLL